LVVISTLRPQGGRLGVPQRLRAFLAADFHHMTADRDLDGVFIQLAVASGATFLNHGFPHSLDFDEGTNHFGKKGRYQDL
jgi:hypothetical protein